MGKRFYNLFISGLAGTGAFAIMVIVLWLLSYMDAIEICVWSSVVAALIIIVVCSEQEKILRRRRKLKMKELKNNQVQIVGEIISPFVFSHQAFGKAFYSTDVRVKRLSNVADIAPIMISERLIDVTRNYEGEYIAVNGQFRSHSYHDGKKNRLALYVFARELEFANKEMGNTNTNQIFLDGRICKTPVYRKTPLGREITDIILAVNRTYGKSDYIPCIFWGRNAKFTSVLEVGTRICISGRIQSRDYTKRISETETETRTGYEVSVSTMEVKNENYNA